MSKYEIEDLVGIFKDHAKRAEKDKKRSIALFKKDHPGEPLPAHFMDNFSLPEALGAICSELLELRKKLG